MISVNRSDGTRGQLGASAVCAAGQNHRYTCTEHDSCSRRSPEEGEILGQHVARFEIWYDKDLCAPRDLGTDALDFSCFRADGIVQRQGAVQQTALDLPAVSHLAQGCRFNRTGYLAADLLNSREDCDPRSAQAKPVMQIN